MSLKLLAAASIACLALTACEHTGPGSARGQGSLAKEDVGTLIGAVGGGLLGSQVGKGKGRIVGASVGTLLGAFAGKSVGASLDRADYAYYDRASNRALENVQTGQTVHWNNPDSGNYGSVTPTRTYQSSGQPCREFSQTIYIGGRAEQGFGTACRQADGTWQLQNN